MENAACSSKVITVDWDLEICDLSQLMNIGPILLTFAKVAKCKNLN